MNRHYILALAAALAAILFLTGCNPENVIRDDDGNTPTEEAIFWGVVGHLVDYRDITPDYKGKTFTATIGSPDNGDESVRVVSLNDPGAAAECYNCLTGASITETTATHTWQDSNVGSLTWHLTGDNTSWATVDVNIPSVPGLHKIIYRSPAQGDTNGSVGDGGSAYYRFGDVIERVRDDQTREYWICVRPSFDPEGKGDSHWVSVSPLPEENIWPYNSTDPEQQGKPHEASNKMHYGLPTNIGDEIKWHQDLAEMLFAIMYPHDWQTNATNFYHKNALGFIDGLRIFNDFSKDNIRYHNEEYWKNVQRQWKAKRIVETVFGVSYEEMAAALNPNNANARGLHLLYDGYSWSVKTSNKPKLFQLHYTNGDGDKEKNMHKQTKKTVSAQVVTPRNYTESNTNFPLDVHNLTQQRPYLQETRFFSDNNPRWIVRYRTGEELSSTGRYDPQQPIPGFTGNNEVYRYYKDVYAGKNLTDAPEITEDGYIGKAHYRLGNVYKDENDDKWFVISPSGYDYSPDATQNHSTFTELVSFDHAGLQISADGSKIINLPSLDEALRAYMFIWRLSMMALQMGSDVSMEMNFMDGHTILNIRDYGNVEVKKLLQSIVAQNNHPRQSSLACCIAYNGAGGIFQPLVRCVMNIQNANNNPTFYCWTKYPSAPNSQTQFVQNFSNVDIMLQDIADQTMVSRYATDTYAVQPLDVLYSPSSDAVTPRSIRSRTDDRALNVRNYFYDMATFRNETFPGSMWNEPILVFRYTRVMDRGDGDYSPTTVDEHTLTLVHERSWDRDYQDIVSNISMVFDSAVGMHLNGKPYHYPTWKEIQND